MNVILHLVVNVHEVIIGAGEDLSFEPACYKTVA